ncbi:MAG: hypothetical protein PHC43_09860 [Candidatus Marinimicrobia bacterium]|nr:hypothetical protein [Candidatus Neomarinimicrobiota bacterium]
MVNIFVVLTFLLFVNAGYAQLLDSDQPPPGIHWRQINTPHYRIIFPAEIESEGQRVANTIEYLYYPLRKTLKPNSRKWPLILSNRNATSNGYVILGLTVWHMHQLQPNKIDLYHSNRM